ncbi:outer membrane protein [Burkholderiales bacterium JOSHI_001]|nr:outer membrane protein [Burkholderiales bacterium JOSHI_001]
MKNRSAAAAALAGLVLLTACATPAPPVVPVPAGAAASAPAAAAPAFTLQVQAPAPLKALLEQHLDLARVARLSGEDAVDDTEWLRLQAGAPAQARALLQTEGHFNAQVQLERDAANPAHLQLRVEPGPLTRVAGFSLVTEGALDRDIAARQPAALALRDALRSSWPLREGTPFRNADWAAAKSALMGRLRSAGYAAAELAGSDASVDASTQQAQLLLVADSGPLFRAGDIQVQGLVAHDADMVRQQAGFGPGTPLTETLLLDYQERLQKTSLFDNVTVSFTPDPAQAGATAVQVQLREMPLRQATLGLGFSDNTGPRVSVEHTHRRPFGWAAIAHNKIELGRDRRAWEGELSSHPGERFYRNLLGWKVERLASDSDVVLSQRLRLGRTQDTPGIERLYFVELENATQSSTGTAAAQRSSAQALSGNYHLVLRRLDNVLLPTRGYTLSLQGALGQAHSSSAASGPFTRLYGRLTGYWPLGQRWYGQARLEAGQVFKRSDVQVPDTLAFRAGGDDSVRGYPYRSLAPTVNGVLDSGNVLFTASAELARPLWTSMPSLWGAVFIDAGRAAADWSGLKPALGYGVGLRWRSPVGPLKLDWAWGDELQQGRFHLSVGIAF